MAYFAKLGTGNIVEQVISINNTIIIDANGVEQEKFGSDFINKFITQEMFGDKLHIIITLEKIMQVLVIQYDQQRDAFIAPKPFNSWILNEDTCRWEAPVALPDTENRYTWNETTTTWDLVE
jgi:hypothetical protein